MLKEKLKEIKNNNYAVPEDINPYDYTLVMMDNIGSTDFELRDSLIYMVITNWIVNKVFTNEQLKNLLKLNVDNNHLFYNIGKAEDDSVFMRTFCALNVATIVYMHRSNKFLSDSEVKMVKEKLVEFYSKEKDLRGFVPVKGWAHSAAHGADALDEIAQCDCINHDDLLDILNAIKNKTLTNSYTYVDFEDERMTTAVVSVIDRNILSQSELIAWIKSFGPIPKTGDHHTDLQIITNVRNLFRSIYFRLLDDNKMPELINTIREILSTIKTF